MRALWSVTFVAMTTQFPSGVSKVSVIQSPESMMMMMMMPAAAALSHYTRS